MTLSDVQIAQQSAVTLITSLLQRVFPTSRFNAFGHKMSWRVTYYDFCDICHYDNSSKVFLQSIYTDKFILTKYAITDYIQSSILQIQQQIKKCNEHIAARRNASVHKMA